MLRSRSFAIDVVVIIAALLAAPGFSPAQSIAQGSIIGTVGLGMAVAPDQFYDYWANGVHVGVERVFPSHGPYALALFAGYTRLPFDEERFLKRMGMSGGTTTVDGAATSIITGGTSLYYSFPPFEGVFPFANAGVCVTYSHRARSTIHYPYQNAESSSQYKFLFSVALSAGFNYPLTETTELTVGSRRYLGLKREKTVNTDWTTLFMGVQWIVP